MKSIDKIIQDFCETYGYEFRSNYSGRCMFGRECVGIVIDASISEFDVLLSLADELRDADFDSAKEKLSPVRYDSMGLGTVLYFPNITCSCHLL